MFAPGIKSIADSLNAAENGVIGCQTGFVILLGIGPLILAPLSETFGRKVLYMWCFTIFTLLQIPTALAKTLPVLVTLRTLAGFFGSKYPPSKNFFHKLTLESGVGIANGGGTISDMVCPKTLGVHCFLKNGIIPRRLCTITPQTCNFPPERTKEAF